MLLLKHKSVIALDTLQIMDISKVPILRIGTTISIKGGVQGVSSIPKDLIRSPSVELVGSFALPTRK